VKFKSVAKGMRQPEFNSTLI